MFPSIRQRVILIPAVVIACVCIIPAAPSLTTATGFDGFSLFSARAGIVGALAIFLMACIPAIACGVVGGVTGNVLSGMFVVSTAMTFFALRGGSSEGWLKRADLPGAYLPLMIETAVWFGLLVALGWIMQSVSLRLRGRFPTLAQTPATDPHEARLAMPNLSAITAGLVAVAIGGGLSYILITNAKSGQVVASLVVTFALGGMAATVATPKNRNVLPIILAPLLTAIVGYAIILTSFKRGDQVLAAWYAGKLAGLAYALPLQYASAGVLGTVLGIGWGQSMVRGEEPAAQEPPGTPVAASAPATASPSDGSSSNSVVR